jgi:hypothetical protein
MPCHRYCVQGQSICVHFIGSYPLQFVITVLFAASETQQRQWQSTGVCFYKKAAEAIYRKSNLPPAGSAFQTIALLAGTMVIIEPELSQKMMRQMNTIHSKKALYQV